VIRALTIGLILYCVIQASLVAAFLIGSPRDIANRPVKHVTPKKVDFKKLMASKVPSVTNAPVKSLATVPVQRWVDYGFNNTNPQFELWKVESKTSLNGSWTPYTNGMVAPGGSVVFRVLPTNSLQVFRVAFVWNP